MPRGLPEAPKWAWVAIVVALIAIAVMAPIALNRGQVPAASNAASSTTAGPSAGQRLRSAPAVEPGSLGARADVADAIDQLLTYDLDGGKVLLALPPEPRPRLVVYLHGATQGAASVVADPEVAGAVAAVLQAGYPVLAADAGGNSWGNEQALDDYTAAVADAAERTGASDVVLWAESMGGLPALQLLDSAQLAVPVVAFAGVYPVCDLSSMQDNPAVGSQIPTAYGPDLDDALRRLSPAPITRPAPMLLWASPEDTVVPKAENADVCAEKMRAAGGRADVIETRGEHGDPSNFDGARLVAFVDAV